MTVGEIAAGAGVSVRSIRYYEASGLLHARRQPNGYREFDASAVERVRAIRDLLVTGFTIEEIRSLASCLTGPDVGSCDCCSLTVSAYRDKLDKIALQMETLARLHERIEQRIAALEPC